MSALWIKYYIYNATHWNLTDDDIQCRPSMENPTKFTNTVDILLFLLKKKRKQNKGEIIKYLLNENRKKNLRKKFSLKKQDSL